MFDGNYRSRRRPVNLSGKSSRQSSALEMSRAQRQARAAQAAKEKAAVQCQCRIRRTLAQRRLIRELDTMQWTFTPGVTGVAFIEHATVMLNFRLRFPVNNVSLVLKQFHELLRQSPAGSSQLPRAPRIVNTALKQLCLVNDDENVDLMCIDQILQALLYNERDINVRLGGGENPLTNLVRAIQSLSRKGETAVQEHLWKCLPQAASDADIAYAAPESAAVRGALYLAGFAPTHVRLSYQECVVPLAQSLDRNICKEILQTSPLSILLRGMPGISDDPVWWIALVETVLQQDSALQLYWSCATLSRNWETLLRHDLTTMEDSDTDLSDDETMSDDTDAPDFKTVTHLEKLYQTKIALWKQRTITNATQAAASGVTIDTASITKLSQSCKWNVWVKTILSGDSSNHQAKEKVVMVLAMLLQTYTGLELRSSASSPLLTQLAFDPSIAVLLWKFIQNGTIDSFCCMMAWSVFSDILAQYWIALKDDEFLERYSETSELSAKELVVVVKNMLYELYWTSPVLGTDVGIVFPGRSVAAARVRVMLCATKLWNSLYQRWCRLVRYHPFCEESAWWFVHVLGMNDHAVVQSSRGDDVDDMEVDEELASAFRDPKTARVLTIIPQALPFGRRIKIFHSLMSAEKARTRDDFLRNFFDDEDGPRHIPIRRDRLYEDSMQQLNKLGAKLKQRIQVSFINQHGTQESGIDGGGVFKEFIDDLIKDAFVLENSTAKYRFFSVTPQETLAVNPDLTRDNSLIPHYEFLGRVLGKAVYESILVEPQFCLPFLNQLLGKQNTLEDLKNYDYEYYRNLVQLLSLPADQLQALDISFEITFGSSSKMRTIELLPGGKDRQVTKENVIQYAHLVAHWRLNVDSARQTRAFLKGFRDLIPASWVRLFSAHELQKLISGDDSVKGIDVPSLQSSMQYAAGYHPSQPIIQWFWQVVEEMSPEQQRKLLKFMTSCSRQPLLGFASMEPAPCIQQIRLPDDLFQNDPLVIEKQTPLPSSATCMNLLKLPNYRSKELLRIKLLAAIESDAGFELT